MRSGILAFAVLTALPSIAYGQRHAGYVIPGASAPRDPPPHFTIAPRGSLLPRTTTVPLPFHGLRPWPRLPRPVHPHGHVGYFPWSTPWPAIVFYVPQPIVVQTPPLERSQRPVEPPAPGRLVLDVAPTTAQVYVDGYYAGTPEDFGRALGGWLLEAGPHRLDISAAGYEAIAVDLMVSAGRPVTYRGSLQRLPPASAAPSTLFYLIPGCYMGNIPPKDAHLPSTCDQSRTVTWHP